MSYILDALRRAEAERERGNVPGVHAQPMFPPSASRSGAPRRSPAWMLSASLAVLLIASAGVWWGVTRSGAGPTGTVSQAASAGPGSPSAASAPPGSLPASLQAPALPPPSSPAPTTVAAAPPLASAPATPMAPIVGPAPVPAATGPQAVVTPAPTRSLDSIVAALPKPAPAASTQTANLPPATELGMPPSMPAAANTAAQPPASPPAPAGPSESRVYDVNELPDDIRRQLPAFAVGGSMYSPTPANRLLIVNGQVLHEGDRVTPELTLVQIKVKAAVLAYKGYRYTVNY